MTPAHYSGYDDPSEYHNLPTEHGNPHTYNLDNSSEFYGASGIQLEPKYQPPPFKNYPRGMFIIFFILNYCPFSLRISNYLFFHSLVKIFTYRQIY